MKSLYIFLLLLISSYQINITIDTSNPVAFSDDGYVGFNFDWHPNNETWWDHNASIQLLNLQNPLLIQSAKLLSPGKMRIGGSEGDDVIYDVENNNCLGYGVGADFCLSMEKWKELVNFAQVTGTKLVFGLNAMSGRDGRNPKNPVNFTNIEAFIKYTVDNNLSVYGFEFGNELPQVPYNVDAQDYNNLRKIINKYWPNESSRPLLIGNDMNPDGGYIEKWLPLLDDLDVLTYHNYVARGGDPSLAQKIMTPSYLNKGPQNAQGVYNAWKSKLPNSQIWVGEIAACWASGQENVTDRFEDNFWYLDAMAARAALNHTGFQRQTMIGGNYELLDRKNNYEPNPSLYGAAIYNKVMGVKVLNAGGWDKESSQLRVYSQCTKGVEGSVTLLAINIDANDEYEIQLNGIENILPREEYHLTAEALNSQKMSLNNITLEVQDDKLPSLDYLEVTETQTISVKPHSIAFYVFKNANIDICKNNISY